LLGIIVALALAYIPTGERDIMLNGAMLGEVLEVKILSPFDILLALFPTAKIIEKAVRVLYKIPNPLKDADWFLLGRALIFEICWYGEDRAQKRAHPDMPHSGIEIFHVDLAPAAFDVAMVRKGIDNRARTPARTLRSSHILSCGRFQGRHFGQKKQ
jgi:hypothetical protein